jgi:hypothetical protein
MISGPCYIQVGCKVYKIGQNFKHKVKIKVTLVQAVRLIGGVEV